MLLRLDHTIHHSSLPTMQPAVGAEDVTILDERTNRKEHA